MATRITEDCTSCGACEDECPTNAISLGAEIFVIDPDSCTECVGFFDTLFARSKTADGIMPAAKEFSAETSHFRAGEAAE